MELDVAVVGGGIAGLAAAHALAKQGLSFLLLEATPRWGGLIRTEHESGFLLEAGADGFLALRPEVLGLVRELGLEERLLPANEVQRAVYVLRRGKLHPLPEGLMLAAPTRILPVLRSRLFSWPGKLRMGLDLVLPARRGEADEPVGRFFARRFGGEAVERLAEPIVAGLHLGDPGRLSMRAVFPFFDDLERRHGSLVRGLGATARASAGPPPAFCSFPEGLSELVRALVSRMPAPSLRRGCPVRSLAGAAGGFALGLEDGTRIAAGAVVVALPTPKAASLVASVAPEAGRELGAIPCASSATVFLGYPRGNVAHPLDGHGLLVPRSEGLRTVGCSFSSTKFPGCAPEGHVLLRALVGGARDPGVLALGDDALVETARRELGPVLGLAGSPVVARVFRWPAASPQMEVGHLERVAEIERHLAAVPRLFLAGGGFRAGGVPDSIVDGLRMAAAAAERVSPVPG